MISGHLTSNLAAYLRAQLDLAHLMLRIRAWEVAQTIIDSVVRLKHYLDLEYLRATPTGYSRGNARRGFRVLESTKISGSQRSQRSHGGQDGAVTPSRRGLEARSSAGRKVRQVSQGNDDYASSVSEIFSRHDCDNLGISAARVTDEASRRVQLNQNLFELLHQSNSFFASRSLLLVSASLTAAAALVFLQVDSAAAVADATTAASAAIAGGDAVAAAAAWTNPLQQVVAAVEQGGDAAGPLGGAVYFTAAYAIAAVLLVPASILTLAAGYLFGAARGTAITLIAATLGASVAFLVARYVARPFVVRQLAGRLGEGRFEALDRAISVGGWRIVLLCRLSPIFPFSISNYVFGITGIGFFEYVASSSLGMLPATFAYVYLGGAGRVALDAVTDATVTTTAAAGAAAGAGSGLDPVQVGLYVVGAVATLLVTREVSSRATKALEEAAAEASADAAGAAGSVSGADGRVGKQE
ncbi:unnamed protein product [Closterium sp. NIES-53]